MIRLKHAPSDMRFLSAYGLAYAGMTIAYMPLLALLLPLKISALGGDDHVRYLSIATLLGAMTASVSNVLFGIMSDREWKGTGRRAGWMGLGALCTLSSYGAVYLADGIPSLILAIVFFQASLNMMLAPLLAVAADRVPDDQKGVLAGFMSWAPALGAVSGMIVTRPSFEGWTPFALIGGLVAVMILPVFLVRTPPPVEPVPAPVRPEQGRRDFLVVWASRLGVQVAGLAVFTYSLYFLQSLPHEGGMPGAVAIAQATGASYALACPVTLAMGWLSDVLQSRKPFLASAAIVMVSGLLLLATATEWNQAVIGHTLFAGSSSVFLMLHSVYAMQLLPSREQRGRDLGFINLTNTLPAMLAPLLVLQVTPAFGFAGLFKLLAGLTFVSGLLILKVRRPG